MECIGMALVRAGLEHRGRTKCKCGSGMLWRLVQCMLVLHSFDMCLLVYIYIYIYIYVLHSNVDVHIHKYN